MLGVDEKWVHPLPMNSTTVLPDTGGVEVTLVEANHCTSPLPPLFLSSLSLLSLPSLPSLPSSSQPCMRQVPDLAFSFSPASKQLMRVIRLSIRPSSVPTACSGIYTAAIFVRVQSTFYIPLWGVRDWT